MTEFFEEGSRDVCAHLVYILHGKAEPEVKASMEDPRFLFLIGKAGQEVKAESLISACSSSTSS